MFRAQLTHHILHFFSNLFQEPIDRINSFLTNSYTLEYIIKIIKHKLGAYFFGAETGAGIKEFWANKWKRYKITKLWRILKTTSKLCL